MKVGIALPSAGWNMDLVAVVAGARRLAFEYRPRFDVNMLIVAIEIARLFQIDGEVDEYIVARKKIVGVGMSGR